MSSTERRLVKEGGVSKMTRVGFLCVHTSTTPTEAIPDNQTELAKFFQSRCDQYHARRSMLHVHQPPLVRRVDPATVPTETVTRVNDLEPINPSQVVAPTEMTNSLHEPENRDVLTLLQSIIRPEYLTKPDLLIKETSIDAFRSNLRTLGCNMQTEANKKYCDTLSKDKYDDNINVHKKERHKPFLDRFCCPWSKRAIQGFLQIALLMSNDGEPGIMNLPKHGGLGHGKRLVAVVPGDTPKNFYKNGKGWLPQLYNAIAGRSMSRYDVCFWLIKLHRFYERKAFDDVCRTSHVASFKMNPHRQIAMFQKNNLTYEHGRRMRPYFNADKCNPLNSERVIRKLEVHPDIKPRFFDFLEEETDRHGWVLPVRATVEAELLKKVMSPDEMHVVLSADHGQRAFRVNVALIQVKGGRVVAEVNRLVGHVDCRKDSTKVLSDSKVLSDINASLIELKEANAKVRLFGSGDLAWYSTALGKPDMAGQHCWRCMSRLRDYQKAPCFVGRPWTLHLMKETCDKLENGQLKRKDKDQERGIMERPTCNCVEPIDWIFPILHGVDLLVNKPFKYLQHWIYSRLEDIPLPLIALRDRRTNCALEVDRLWDDVVEAEEHKLAMEEELRLVQPEEMDAFDDDEHEEEWRLQKEVVANAVTAVTKATDAHNASKTKHKKLTAEANALEKKKTMVRKHGDFGCEWRGC